MNDTELHNRAVKQAKAKLGWYIHATVFVLVNLFQVGINIFTAPQVPWSIFPVLGWGLGLGIHGLVVFGFFGNLQQNLIAAELLQLRRKS